MTRQLIGLKNVRGQEAVERHGKALFAKENDKSRADRIPAKIFEIEQRLLLKKRSAWTAG